jgi:hypothetical protein
VVSGFSWRIKLVRQCVGLQIVCAARGQHGTHGGLAAGYSAG